MPLQRWESGSHFAGFARRRPDRVFETVRFRLGHTTISRSNTSVQQAAGNPSGPRSFGGNVQTVVPYFAAFSLLIPGMRAEIVKIGPCPTISRSNTRVQPTVGSLSAQGSFGGSVGKAVPISPLSPCLFPICTSKSPKSVLALPPFRYRTPESDRLLKYNAFLAAVTVWTVRFE